MYTHSSLKICSVVRKENKRKETTKIERKQSKMRWLTYGSVMVIVKVAIIVRDMCMIPLTTIRGLFSNHSRCCLLVVYAMDYNVTHD